MHYLHKILVYIPDAVFVRRDLEKADLIESIRTYAENETESYSDQAFDWRETDCAGRWSTEYPTNVLLAEDDSTRFVNELSTAMEEQQNEIQCCLAQLENTVGIDLKQVVKRLLDKKSYEDSVCGEDAMTQYYLHCIAAHLHGEYRCDSYFYNTHDYTARIYPADIEAVKSEPHNWALVMFDYHY